MVSDIKWIDGGPRLIVTYKELNKGNVLFCWPCPDKLVKRFSLIDALEGKKK